MKIEFRNIHKRFGAVHANNDVSFIVPTGKIYGLIGENGAGKSTLMKQLSGYFSSDSGQILLDDRPVKIVSPADAVRQGIGMLHQDPLDFPPMRLLENFMTACNHGVILPQSAALKAFNDLCKQFDFDLDPNAFVNEVTVGERQQLEIIRLLWLGVRTLILDEPTTGISAIQKVKLFQTLKKLAQQGMSILFVSHKLEDVQELCGELAVLKRGVLVGTLTAPFDERKMVQLMFDQAFELHPRSDVPLGDSALDLKDVTIVEGPNRMEHANLQVRKGEVIGIAGLEGSGQRLLMQSCAGLLRPLSGYTAINGIDLSGKGYPFFEQNGVAFLPADRLVEGLVSGMTIAEHAVLLAQKEKRPEGKGLFINWKAAIEESDSRIKDFRIKGRPESTVNSLSGGNQQRTQLALLPAKISVLIMEHPTRGLDIESANYIWDKLLKRRDQGACILYSSADLDEILQYSDRVLVCFANRIHAIVPRKELSSEDLGYLIGGKSLSDLKSLAM
ncbi:MAG TPA: ATP-binding cassette domain-containing protein [Anaerolineales bacterium]|nr:ATP-binding cassette domain-containing protein [Anaerolineales bacterium]